MKNYILLGIALFVIGCVKQSETNYKRVYTVDIVSDREDSPECFDSFFRYDHYIVLETTDSSMVGQIAKIQFNKDRLYILSDNRIQTFDQNGKFIRTYNHTGEGPKEYLRLTDFDIRNDSLYLLDHVGKKVLIYSLEDQFLSEVQSNGAHGLKLLSGGILFHHHLGGSGSELYSYSYFDGQTYQYQIPFNEALQGRIYTFGNETNNFYSQADELLTYVSYNDTIYAVDTKNGQLSPRYSVPISHRTVRKGDSRAEVTQLLKSGVPATIFNFYKWNSTLLFSYSYKDGQSRETVLYDTEKGLLFKGAFRMDSNGIPIQMAAYDTDAPAPRKLMNVVNTFVLKSCQKNDREIEKHALLHEIAGRVDEESNPVLIFYNYVGEQ